MVDNAHQCQMHHRHLYKNEKRLEMLATPDLEEGWTNAFKEIGVFQEVKGSIHSQEPQKRGWNVFSRSKSTATNHTEVFISLNHIT